MKANSLKDVVKGVRFNIAIIVLAALLAEATGVVQYIYTRRTIREQTARRASHDFQELQRVTTLKTSVEAAVKNALGEVETSLDQPDKFYGIVTRLVQRSPSINGSAVAMRPNFYPSKDPLFAPFAYQEKEDQRPLTKLLPYNYTAQDWYSKPFKSDSAQWSLPYQDTGGSDLLIYTYGMPIHNSHNQVVGILTADVSFKMMTSRESYAYEHIDRVHLLVLGLQLFSLLLIIFIIWRSASNIHKVNKLMIEQNLLTKEIQIANDIHSSMLPVVSDRDNDQHHLDLQVELIPAPNVSADFYDYLYIGNHLVFCIGDVPGSNVMASLMMSVTRSVFRTAATPAPGSPTVPSPAAIVSSMNRAISSINHNQMFTTLFVGALNLQSAQLVFCSAGSPPPIVLSPSLGAKMIQAKPNIPVGIMSDFEYEEQKVTLIDDFVLFLYSDGLYEAENSYNEPLGIKRVGLRLENCARNGDSPRQVLDKIKDMVIRHMGSKAATDDVMMIALKVP
jgi:serine phosphatase RsbU (regulator of sigma subunit)